MSNKGKGVKVSAAFSLMNLPHQPPYSNASAEMGTMGDGSLKTKVGRIQSGRTGGGIRNRKLILRRRKSLNGGRNKMWGTMTKVTSSMILLGMMT